MCARAAHTHLILTTACVVGTNKHSHFTDEKTTRKDKWDDSETVSESVPGRGSTMGPGAGKPGGESPGDAPWALLELL